MPQEADAGLPYRALCPLAVLSVAAGAASIPLLPFWFSWMWAVAPLAGIVLGWHALRRIDRAPSELAGRRLARLGIGFSAAIWVLGYGWLMLSEAREIPYGYEPISYDILQPDPNAPADPIPQSALALQDKRVFIKGFMRPGRRQSGIKDFVLVPIVGDCPFCIPNPKRTEMIRVVLQGDLDAVYTTHQVGVGGRFQIDPTDLSGIPYALEADYFH